MKQYWFQAGFAQVKVDNGVYLHMCITKYTSILNCILIKASEFRYVFGSNLRVIFLYNKKPDYLDISMIFALQFNQMQFIALILFTW